jgi:hypothetical protein
MVMIPMGKKMINFDKYKNTIIKLINCNNSSEIYGYLIDWDEEGGMLKLDRPIISMNRMVADPADTFHRIIKYEYKSDLGSTMTVAAATLYKNDGDNNIAYFNYKDFIMVPLYENSILSDKIKDKDKYRNQLNIKKQFEEYIEYFYSTMKDFVDDINSLTEDISTENNIVIDDENSVEDIVKNINNKEK